MPLSVRAHASSVVASLLAVLASSAGAGRASAQTTPRPPGAPAPAAVPAAPVPVLQAQRVSAAPRLDGRLDEPAWATAAPGSGFTQSWPNPGAAPSERTEVRVLYDDAALYVGMRMFDAHPDSIAAQLARRDATGIYSDWAHVMVDSYHDRRTAFRFSVNPKGVQKDAFHSDDTSEDINWDAVWQVGTAVDSAGWVAEYRIPFSQLRFGRAPAGEGRRWGLQVQREIARRNERDTWSPWTQRMGGYVSRAGDLVGLEDVPTPRRLEVMPYASARLTRAPSDPGNPFYRRNDGAPSVGADLKYGLPGSLTLTATVNPDFGQVEVDPAVVNLSAFEVFFPERRPFFVEGANVFNFGRVRVGPSFNFQQFFYSRRIGRRPQRGLGGYEFVDAPQQSTILAAAKVSGRTGPWTVGVLDAATGEERARFVTRDGVRGDAPVEPRTNYLVGRVRRDLRAGNTVVGGMFSAVNRDLSDSAFTSLVRSRALLGGVDFEHLWGDRNWSVSGYTVASSVGGSAPVIAATQRAPTRSYDRPDADHLRFDATRRTLGGHMSELAVQKRGNVNGSVDFKQVSPGFEVNDVGFQQRVDYRSVTGGTGYNQFDAGEVLRSWNVFAGHSYAWNFGGDRIWQNHFGEGGVTFNNLWYAGLYGGYRPGAYDDRLTRGGPLARVPTSRDVGTYGGSDSRKTVSANWNGGVASNAAGGRSSRGSITVSVRPSSSVLVSVGPSVNRDFSINQYVTRSAPDSLATATLGRRYLFADLRQTTVSADTRVDWTFTPRLSLQLFAQPFVSAGRYARFKELRAAGSGAFDVYGRDVGTVARDTAGVIVDPDGAGAAAPIRVGTPDFNVRSLRGNAVVRWEYRPGSALFFVWQQQRSGAEPFGDFALRRDAGALFREPATNVFLVKATFWAAR